MENKPELHFIASSDGKICLEVKTGHINGPEAKIMTLGLLDNIANAFTENTLEKIGFLKSVHDGIEKLMLETLLD